MNCHLDSASARRWLVTLPLLFSALAALAQDAPRMVKSVHGYRIALAVESELKPERPGADSRHAQALEHRLLVSVREAAGGRTASIASVLADVAESGYSGETIALSPRRSGDDFIYEGRTQLETKKTYRILVRAMPAAGSRAVEAQFDYRHHH